MVLVSSFSTSISSIILKPCPTIVGALVPGFTDGSSGNISSAPGLAQASKSTFLHTASSFTLNPMSPTEGISRLNTMFRCSLLKLVCSSVHSPSTVPWKWTIMILLTSAASKNPARPLPISVLLKVSSPVPTFIVMDWSPPTFCFKSSLRSTVTIIFCKKHLITSTNVTSSFFIVKVWVPL